MAGEIVEPLEGGKDGTRALKRFEVVEAVGHEERVIYTYEAEQPIDDLQRAFGKAVAQREVPIPAPEPEPPRKVTTVLLTLTDRERQMLQMVLSVLGDALRKADGGELDEGDPKVIRG